MENLFILKTISITEKTKESCKKEWEIRNLRFENNKISYEKFLESLDFFNGKNFSYHDADNCYFTELSKAKEYAEENICDINDGGLYEYIAIVEIPFNCAYAETEGKSIYIFKFNNSTGKYDEVPMQFNDETRLIAKENHFL